MKKKIFFLLISSVSVLNVFAQELNTNTFKNPSSYQRNQIGECDSACEVEMPIMSPPLSAGTPLILNPPVGAIETRTIDCQTAGFPANYVGQVNQNRSYYTQNGVVIASLTGPWNTFSNTCRAANNCASTAVSWTQGGYTCNALVPALNHGNSVGVTDTTLKTTGGANYSCNDGTLIRNTESCNYIPDDCTAGMATWTVGINTCSAAIGATLHNASVNLTDFTFPNIGDSTMTCNDGTYLASNLTCDAPPTGCSAGTVTIRYNNVTGTTVEFPGEGGRQDNMGFPDWGNVITNDPWTFDITASGSPTDPEQVGPDFAYVGYTDLSPPSLSTVDWYIHSVSYQCIRTCAGSLVSIPTTGSAATHCGAVPDEWHWTPTNYTVKIDHQVP